VLVGKEHVLADAAIDKVVAAAVPDESLRALNVDALDAQTIDAAGDIISRVSALPPPAAITLRRMNCAKMTGTTM